MERSIRNSEPSVPLGVDTHRGTVCLTVDNLGMALAIGRGRAARPDLAEPGLKHGLPAFLTLFRDLGLRATWFVEGWNALHHRDILERVALAGHDIGLHGWLHERWSEDLDDRARQQLLWDGTAAMRSIGLPCRAFRAPGGYRGGGTLETLAELGYEIDSSIGDGMGVAGSALEVSTLPGNILSIPWTWDMIDHYLYFSYPDGARNPAQLAAHWKGMIDRAADHGGLVTLIVHPFVSGVADDRMAALRDVLEHAVSHANMDVMSAQDVAESRRGERPR